MGVWPILWHLFTFDKTNTQATVLTITLLLVCIIVAFFVMEF